MKKIYNDIIKLIDIQAEIAKKINFTSTEQKQAFNRGFICGLENSKEIIIEVFCKLYFTKYEETKSKQWEKIKEKRKISPYYGQPLKYTCRHYELQAQKIKEFLQNKEYYTASDLYKKCKKELYSFKSKNLNLAYMSFLDCLEKRDIEFLENFNN